MKKMTALLLAALMVLSMAACASKPAETAESDLAYIQDKGTLVVGITDFAPMDYQNESGEWVGFDADLAKAFAESLGVKVEFVEIVWDNKVLELDSKTIDCVWNGMTIMTRFCQPPFAKKPAKPDSVASFNRVSPTLNIFDPPYARTTSGAPVSTTAPLVVTTCATVPSRGARISFSIFMASSTTRMSPALTA